MITEKQLQSKKYNFKHIKVDIVEKDDQGNVLVFAGTVVTTKLPGQSLSEGQLEINRTLWKEGSPKRPDGYWVLGTTAEQDGLMKSYFVSDEWLDHTPKEVKQQKRFEWGL
ncbi:hypothetical protein ACFVS2_21720 [Brevibacillus sp. NPDC058079]|uniref:hypothetical protein n=1 Tax=Brevibacillus sp. NPDC058079 TaxID=3346330 RepID=UPI0036EF85EF